MQTDIDVEKIRKLLKGIEWQTRLAHCHSVDSSGGRSQCRTCWNEKYQGHQSDCKLAQALSLLKGQPCETCGGSGKIGTGIGEDGRDFDMRSPEILEPCPACKGTGQAPAHRGRSQQAGKVEDWRTEFQYLLDRKILSRDELAYLFGQIKSIIDREKSIPQAQAKRCEQLEGEKKGLKGRYIEAVNDMAQLKRDLAKCRTERR